MEIVEHNKLITLVTQPRAKASRLKSILELEGITAFICEIDFIESIECQNVKIKVNIQDLSKSITILENFYSSDIRKNITNEILIPIDFSFNSEKAYVFAFNLAKELGCEIKFIHIFLNQTTPLPSLLPTETSFIPSSAGTIFKKYKESAEHRMSLLEQEINLKIEKKEIPNIKFSYIIEEGIPEETIIKYTKKINPQAIVVGTKGSNAKDNDFDIIGSIIADVMEGSKSPIFIMPNKADLIDISKIKNIVFLTNFKDREFKTLDLFMTFIKNNKIKILFTHLLKKEEVFDNAKFSVFENFIKENYPQIDSEYKVIELSSKLEDVLDTFTKQNNIDLICLSSSRRNILSRTFNPGIAKKMLFYSDTPLFITN